MTTLPPPPTPPKPPVRFFWRTMDEVPEVDVSWLWPQRIPAGMLSFIAGRPEVGKSWIAQFMAATVSRGTPWPDSPEPNPAGRVVYICSEMGMGRVRKRLRLLGANLSNIITLDGVGAEGRDRPDGRLQIFRHAERLEEWLVSLGDVRLVIFDPLKSFLRDGIDLNSQSEVRPPLEELNAMAERSGIAVVGLAHPHKGGAATALESLAGSSAFGEVARASWLVVPEGGEPLSTKPPRLMLCAKMEPAESPDTGVRFMMLPDNEGMAYAGMVTGVRADDFVQPPERKRPAGGKRGAVEEWLREQLQQGPQWLKDLEREARILADDWGVEPSRLQYTLTQARNAIRAVTQKHGFGSASKSYWYLPSHYDGSPPPTDDEGASV